MRGPPIRSREVLRLRLRVTVFTIRCSDFRRRGLASRVRGRQRNERCLEVGREGVERGEELAPLLGDLGVALADGHARELGNGAAECESHQ